MKLNSDTLAVRLTHEGIRNFASLSDFDNNGIENLYSVWNKSVPVIEADVSDIIAAEASVAGSIISSISVSRLITAVNSMKHQCYMQVSWKP